MKENVNITSVNPDSVRKSYVWILLLASVGLIIGFQINFFIIKIEISQITPSILTNNLQERSHYFFLCSLFSYILLYLIPMVGAIAGYLIEKRRKYEIHIALKVVGYLTAILAALPVFYFVWFATGWGVPEVVYFYLTPLFFTIGLCVYRKWSKKIVAIIVSIIVILVFAATIGFYFHKINGNTFSGVKTTNDVNQKSSDNSLNSANTKNRDKCGDGVCDSVEKSHLNACPQDCK